MSYSTGTVNFTKGSTAVAGANTLFVANAEIGDTLVGADGRSYSIASVATDASLALSTAYEGKTAFAAAYSITRGAISTNLPTERYPEIAAPYSISPASRRWDLLSFAGAQAENAKTSATQSWGGVLNAALLSGEKVAVPAGNYPLREYAASSTEMTLVTDQTVDVECAADAKFVGTVDLPTGVGQIIKVLPSSDLSPTNLNQTFSWKGGRFDFSALNTPDTFGVSVFDIYKLFKPKLSEVRFYAGTGLYSDVWGACDTGVTTHNCFGETFQDNSFVGFYDSGIYLSGDKVLTALNFVGQSASLSRNLFYRCSNGTTAKRAYMNGTYTDNDFLECGRCIASGDTSDSPDGTHGNGMHISGGSMQKTQSWPVYIERGGSCSVKGVRIQDWGRQLDGDTVFTTASSRIAAIDIRGADNPVIKDNNIQQVDWAGGTPTSGNDQPAIQLFHYDSTDGCTHAVVKDNYIKDAQREVIISQYCSDTLYEDNTYIVPTAGSTFDASDTGVRTVFRRPIERFTKTEDPASIAADATQTIAITATGVRAGDIVVEQSMSRGSTSTGVDQCTFEAYAGTDVVDIVIRNVSTTAANIGNTVFAVGVRRAASP